MQCSAQAVVATDDGRATNKRPPRSLPKEQLIAKISFEQKAFRISKSGNQCWNIVEPRYSMLTNRTWFTDTETYFEKEFPKSDFK